MESIFHPIVRRWFARHFREPTPAQNSGWRAVAAGHSTLIAAPTGSGKTLAAFLWSIDRLFKRAVQGALQDATSVVYVSPLKALGNDIAKNLQAPLAEILQLAWSEGLLLPEIRVAVRTGDTPAHERQTMIRTPPHILITTPESLYILLTASRSRAFLSSAETVIVDEIHAVAADKRGAHLALSLERLDALVDRPLQRIGLSATQKPIEEVARLLVGTDRISPQGKPQCIIVNAGHKRALDLRIELPDQDLGPIVRHEIWAELFDKIAAQVKAHRTTLVFVNTRRLVERVAHQLSERLGEGKVGAHHGSLSRKTRLDVEGKLKSGELPVVVATASLELGIDIGHVDVVCHIGSARSIGVLLQRVGRSGHWLAATPKGILYPLTRDDLIECVALIRAVRAGDLDRLGIVDKPLDILAQQMVAAVAAEAAPGWDQGGSEGISEEALWQLVRRAYPYRSLSRGEFDQVLEMLSEGISTRRSRRSAYIHRDRIHGMLRARRGARLTAITNGGAIPDTADYDVIEFPDETFVGKVNEDFAVESLAGDIFLLGNRSWRIRRVSSGKVLVEDAQGLAPTIPFWLGEGPGRTLELSRAVSDLRDQVAARRTDRASAQAWLRAETGIPEAGAEQIVDYIRDSAAVLGVVPTQERIVAERFFDESGGMQLIIHSPWGGRINRAWGLALRKRFCVSFNRELQAAATDDGICISLVEQHSFPLGDVFLMLPPGAVDPALTQASLASPMFANRWRWNASRALALLRQNGGKKIPVAIQRMRAEDLLAAVFPAQVMCQDNQTGPIEIPDHPLVRETLRDCLHEAMDSEGLKELVAGILEQGTIETVCVDTPVPSPMAHEILNANPYAFLDDAPLEERRARAVSLRRVDPWLDREFGRLDPAAIQEVREQAWPDLRNSDELHDLLLGVGLLPLDTNHAWGDFAETLVGNGRATVASWSWDGEHRRQQAYVAAERWSWIKKIIPDARAEPELHLPAGLSHAPQDESELVLKIVHGWLEILGPTTVAQLGVRLGLEARRIESAMLALESSGVVLRGQYSGDTQETEWCERGLLARIHRMTLGRMRREIEPVSATEFMKFLISWQHATSGSKLRGREGVLQIVRQLQGLELPAPAWEQHVLPARIENYDPADLEQLCLAGVVAWGRLRSEIPDLDDKAPNQRRHNRRRPTRRAPIALMIREERDYFLDAPSSPLGPPSILSPMAREVADYLATRGASFLSDIARGTGLLKVKAEEALWELVARGVATGDGVAGLRVLLTPDRRRHKVKRRLRLINGGQSERMMPVGRWSLWRGEGGADSLSPEQRAEHRARQVLARYGVVFRELLLRENSAPSWRILQQIYRRLEARGEIRGGRFVAGFAGEQFALPEAVDRLRAERRLQAAQEPLVLASADPLNLLGVLSPGARVSPYAQQAIVYANGQAIEVGPLGSVRSKLHRNAQAARLQEGF